MNDIKNSLTLPDMVALHAIPMRNRFVGMEVIVLDTDGLGTKKKYTLVDGIGNDDWIEGVVGGARREGEFSHAIRVGD